MVKSMNQIAQDIIKITIMDDSIPIEDKFDTIQSILAGNKVYFTNGIKERNKKIKEDYWNGMLPLELADKYRLSLSRIYRIVEKKS